jgi:hypothetical protein
VYMSMSSSTRSQLHIVPQKLKAIWTSSMLNKCHLSSVVDHRIMYQRSFHETSATKYSGHHDGDIFDILKARLATECSRIYSRFQGFQTLPVDSVQKQRNGMEHCSSSWNQELQRHPTTFLLRFFSFCL